MITSNFPRTALATILLLPALAPLTAPAAPPAVQLNWIDGAPPAATAGVSWGVPWPRGAVPKDQTFALTTADHQSVPLQTWPLAYWPDGSLKWSGFAAVGTPGLTGPLTLAAGTPAAGTLRVRNDGTTIVVDTGALQCSIPAAGGANLVTSLMIADREVARAGQLVCVLQTGPEGNAEDVLPRERFTGLVKKVTVEQTGPVRAVVRFEGVHRGEKSGREWLPFSVRLYFYSGETTVRMVHTIVFDGHQERDFVRGLGVTFAVPLREQVFNRHVRFSGEGDGLWAEPIQPGAGNAPQAAGQRIANYNAAYAVFDDFKLMQPTPDGFTLVKRTGAASTWLAAGAGRRSSGLAFVGDVSGGLGVTVKNFWQSFPTSLEVQHARAATAQLTAWLWSPDGPAMDLRHYDTVAHGLGPTYEDVQPGLSTALGIGRTSELTFFATGAVPAKAETAARVRTGTAAPMLAAPPEYVHSTGVFGAWSVQDRSTPFKQSIEDALDSTLAFYEKQVDERHWYGFWQFGDFIHSYNAAEHTWYYDFGGHAWDNTELGAPLWLWYSYLRTGRADLFRLAEAHTRNTSETNVYHLGPMLGLGTRHNVVTWGDGAKEARISQSTHWRFYYYLTTDERVGDIMHDNLSADVAVGKYDPMRIAFPPKPGDPPSRIRVGPDWLALVSNWMTEWERTGDTQWRDRILVGVHDLAKMPYGLRSGQNLVMGWDPVGAHLAQISPDAGSYNLATIQGGGELGIELSALLDDPDWQRVWSQYCRLLAAPAAVLTQDNTTHAEGAQAQYYGNGGGNADSIARLAGFAYRITKNPAYAQVAIGHLGVAGGGTRIVNPPEVLNAVTEPNSDTNGNSQRSLAAIEVLDLCADQLPTAAPAAPARGAGGGRRGGG